MKFEKLSYGTNNIRKGIIIGFVLSSLIFVIINFFLTKAKYQITESIPLANGTINYNPYDFKIMAMYTVDSTGKETPIETMPESGYTINEDRSYCTLNNDDHDFNAKLYTNDNGEHIIKGLSKNEKCYLYFNEKNQLCPEGATACETILSYKTLGDTCPELDENDDGIITEAEETNAMICKAGDDYGTSYYYRGTVDNNWVKFGKQGNDDIWWRIIRINGNGTIRLIYAGKGSDVPDTTGTGTMMNNTTYKYNNEYDNRYVGFMYGDSTNTYNATHENKNKSTVMSELEKWYETTNLETINSKIDVNTGFCNDRSLGVGYENAGYGMLETHYGAYDRINNGQPTLKCGKDEQARKRDLFTGPNAKNDGIEGKDGQKIVGNNKLTKPVGLITIDEVEYAGGFGGKSNKKYWLYTNEAYWTMSPHSCYNANIFHVDGNGYLNNIYTYNLYIGVRPVINLKSTVTFEEGGNGTSTKPYVVKTN